MDVKQPFEGVPTQFICCRAIYKYSADNLLNILLHNVIDNALEKSFSNLRNSENECYRRIITENAFVERIEFKEASTVTNEMKSKRIHLHKLFGRQGYSEFENLVRFCEEHPLGVLIIGQPDPDISEIGKLLAQKLMSNYIDPNTLVNDQIRRKTKFGKWIYSNLKAGRKIPVQLAMEMLRTELKKDKYAVRGYVISGFPFIPNLSIGESQSQLPIDIENVSEVEIPTMQRVEGYHDSDSSDSCYDENCVDSEEDTGNEEESGYSLEQSNLSDYQDNDNIDDHLFRYTKNYTFSLPTSSDVLTSESVNSQLQTLSNLSLCASVIVYVSGDEADILSKRSKNENPVQVQSQLRNYNLNFASIQKYIVKYQTENVFVVTIHLGIQYALQCVLNRLKYWLYKEIYIPEVVFSKCVIPVHFEAFLTDNDVTASFQVLCATNRIMTQLNWSSTDFGTKCPVQMYRGRIMQGELRYAVRYLKNLYLLSSPLAVRQFVQNPQKYIFVRPTCRLAILGGPRLGKTVLSEVFAKILNCEVYSGKKQVSALCHDYCENQFANARSFANEEASNIQRNMKAFYENLKSEKLLEWEGVIQPILTEISEFLEATFEKHIPSRWTRILEWNRGPQPHEELAEFFFEERLFELYENLLVANGVLARDCMKWIGKRDMKERENLFSELCYGQWVLDGLPLDISFWETLYSNGTCPRVVILLKNSSVDKCEEIHGKNHNKIFHHFNSISEEMHKTFPNLFYSQSSNEKLQFKHSISKNSNHENHVREYAHFLAQRSMSILNDLEEISKTFFAFFNKRNIEIITVNIGDKSWKESILEALIGFMALFEDVPKTLTNGYFQGHTLNQKQLEESKDVSDEEDSVEVLENVSSNSESESDEEEPIDEEFKKDFPNWNFGNLYDYCPVMFKTYNILARGRPEYSAQYRSRIYCMHSKVQFEEFLINFRKYTFEHEKPVPPPPRIFIAGLNHTDKQHFADLLADEFKVKRYSYQNLMQNFVSASNTLNEDFAIDTLRSMYEYISDDFLTKLSSSMKLSGGVVSGFPILCSQFDHLVSNNFNPEAVFIMDDKDEILHAVFRHFLRLYVLRNSSVMRRHSYESDYYFRNVSLDSRLSSLNSSLDEVDIQTQKDITEQCKSMLKPYFSEIIEIEKKCAELNIPVYKVPKNYKQRMCASKYVHSINRKKKRPALFDQVRLVTMTQAELLVKTGYCRHSRFKLSCPVDVANLNLANEFCGSAGRGKVYPCVYREFLYFLNGYNNYKLFRFNPWPFIRTCNPAQLIRPLRISVMGPPLSGCTTMSKRIAKQYGMLLYNQRDFKQMLQNQLRDTRIGKDFLRNGYQLTDQLIVQCIKIVQSSAPNGIVLDNFPFTGDMVFECAQMAVHLHLIIIILPDFKDIYKFWRAQLTKRKTWASEALQSLVREYVEFECRSEKMTRNVKLAMFNIIQFSNDGNVWQCWEKLHNKIAQTVRCLVGYEIRLQKGACTSLSHLNVLYDTFDKKVTPFYCPVCLSINRLTKFRYDHLLVGDRFYSTECQDELCQPLAYKNADIYRRYNFPHPFTINEGVTPLLTDNLFDANMIQHRDEFYWLCNSHVIDFLTNASNYVPPKWIPLYVPFLVLDYKQYYLACDGYCVVSYTKGKYEKGLPEFSAYYRGKIFLFAKSEFALEFLAYPEIFFYLEYKPQPVEKINWDLKEIQVDYKNLTPDLLTAALSRLVKERPLHYAMSIESSASQYLALSLKLLNSSSPTIEKFWKEKSKEFCEECEVLPKMLKKFRNNCNPFMLLNAEAEEMIAKDTMVTTTTNVEAGNKKHLEFNV